MLSRDSVRYLVLVATVGVVCALWPAAASAGSDLERHLNDEYKGKTLILRGFYSGDHLTYDSSGHILNPTVPDDWTVAGVVQVESLKLSGDRLRIDARRVHLGWVGGVFQELHDHVAKLDKDEKADRSLRIDVDLGSATSEAADKVLSNVFLTSRDNFADLVPDYWKPCVRAGVIGEGGKQYSACHFSQEFTAIPGVASVSGGTSEAEQTRAQVPPSQVAALRVGNGVTFPKIVSQSDPQFSEGARRAKYQGTAAFSLIVDKTGRARDIRIVRPLGAGLDQKAVEVVSGWRFDPARKNGEPVEVEIAVEVDFHLR
jgi:TonB family protein